MMGGIENLPRARIRLETCSRRLDLRTAEFGRGAAQGRADDIVGRLVIRTSFVAGVMSYALYRECAGPVASEGEDEA